jgi:hypothetical protein
MLNEASLRSVAGAAWRGPLIRPLYDSYCFSRLPATICSLFTGDNQCGLPGDVLSGLEHRYETVVLFFVDGFGWRYFEKFAERYPILRYFLDNGVVSKLTAMFPSTTAAHVTCIHTGLPPGQSGVYEWFQYQPEVDRIIAPLLFSPAGDKARNRLVGSSLKPEDVFPLPTIYPSLDQAGVKTYLFHSREIVKGAPMRLLSAGTQSLAYKTLPELLTSLRHVLEQREGRTYCLAYYDAIDSIGHDRGPGSDYVEAELDQFLTSLERLFVNRLRDSRILLILAADHGMVEVNPNTTVYLNVTMPDFRDCIVTNRKGELLTPAGSPRDFFLHVKPERLTELRERLSEHLQGKALVVETMALAAEGFFGPCVSERFLARVGNLVVLPFAGESVYYYERDRFENRYWGHHGGLTREEMEIPLMIAEL